MPHMTSVIRALLEEAGPSGLTAVELRDRAGGAPSTAATALRSLERWGEVVVIGRELSGAQRGRKTFRWALRKYYRRAPHVVRYPTVGSESSSAIILRALRNAQLTTRDLALELGFNIRVTWSLLQKLADRGLIERTGKYVLVNDMVRMTLWQRKS